MSLVAALPAVVKAQVTGVVSDSIAGRRVPGAVITVLDSARQVIARSLADDSGRFRLDATGSWRLRVVKIGYRPKELRVTAPASLRIALERLPSLLAPVRTSDQPKCSRNGTRPAAFGLWEQAKAALLGTVIARETNIAQVRRVSFRRYMTPRGDAIQRQSVERETSHALRSFDASRKASEFGARGFVEPVGVGQLIFYGPDAEVLLDDELVNHYCLELAAPGKTRPQQAGLRFRPMYHIAGRVEIDGTLWIDTVARALTDIEFGYVGLDRWANSFRPGGTVTFKETSPATVWIDGWTIRMTGAGIDYGGRPMVLANRRLQVVEGGAVLASATWPDGREWDGHLGIADLTVRSSDGKPLGDARVKLDSTDYGGVTDAAGRLAIDELLPGPYTLSVVDSALAVVDTTLPASPGFMAAKDSVSRPTLTVPSLVEFVASGCKAQDSPLDAKSKMLVARVARSDTVRIRRVKWRLVPPAGALTDPNAPVGYYAEGETGGDGMIYICSRLLQATRVVLQVWAPGDNSGVPAETGIDLRERVTTVKVRAPQHFGMRRFASPATDYFAFASYLKETFTFAR